MALPRKPALNAAFRTDLRRDRIALREAIAAENHARFSAALERHLDGLLAARARDVIAFCWPIRSEFDCRPLVARLIARGWRACIPSVVAADRPMEFRAWAPGDALAVDRHGIPIPAKDQVLQPGVVLLPLVAFDTQGFRLGYGGGYFDRTLAGQVPRPLCIGVGFEVARVASIRPEAHDLPMDAVVTEAGAQFFSAHRWK